MQSRHGVAASLQVTGVNHRDDGHPGESRARDGTPIGVYAGGVILAVFIALIVLFVVLPLFLVSIFFVIKTAVIGLIMGALGRLIVPGQQAIGLIATICCGWIGALVGGGIAHAAGLHWFASTLLTLGVAAASVALWDLSARKRVGGGRKLALGRGRW